MPGPLQCSDHLLPMGFKSCIRYFKRIMARSACPGSFRDIYLPPEFARGAYFHGRDVFFAMKYFSEWTLALEVYNRLFIDSLGFITVDRIKKHLPVVGLT